MFDPIICTTNGAEFSDDETAVIEDVEHIKRVTRVDTITEEAIETKITPEPSFLPIIDHVTSKAVGKMVTAASRGQ